MDSEALVVNIKVQPDLVWRIKTLEKNGLQLIATYRGSWEGQ